MSRVHFWRPVSTFDSHKTRCPSLVSSLEVLTDDPGWESGATSHCYLFSITAKPDSKHTDTKHKLDDKLHNTHNHTKYTDLSARLLYNIQYVYTCLLTHTPTHTHHGKEICAAYRKDYHMTGKRRTTTLDNLKEHHCDKCNTETTINIQRAQAVVYGVVRHPRSRFREWELWQNRPSGRPNWKQENKHSQGKLLQSSLQLLLRSDSFCPTCLEQCRSLCYSHNTSLQTTQMEKEHSTTKARGGEGGVRERERKGKLKMCGKRTHTIAERRRLKWLITVPEKSWWHGFCYSEVKQIGAGTSRSFLKFPRRSVRAQCGGD